jgi:carotenoid 1,2-hydratase
VIAQRFDPDGSASPSSRRRARRCRARLAHRRTHAQRCGRPPRVQRTLEDTPFYVRSVLRGALLGERVTRCTRRCTCRAGVAPVQLMLPFRMPRRGEVHPEPA